MSASALALAGLLALTVAPASAVEPSPSGMPSASPVDTPPVATGPLLTPAPDQTSIVLTPGGRPPAPSTTPSVVPADAGARPPAVGPATTGSVADATDGWTGSLESEPRRPAAARPASATGTLTGVITAGSAISIGLFAGAGLLRGAHRRRHATARHRA